MIHLLQSAKKDYLWGGTRLITEFNKKTDKDIMAESWELSTHEAGTSTIDGVLLSDYIKNHPGCLGEGITELPFMIKLIDAKTALSIQVHPSNRYAKKYENASGKTETWYIVDCNKDSFLYQGLDHKSNKEEIKAAISDNTICDLLSKKPIKPGDVYHIPSGTIHAICSNTLVYEIQQNSNITYRLYDYDRRGTDGKPRELHVDKSLDVINYDKTKNQGKKLVEENKDYKLEFMSKTSYYEAHILTLHGKYNLKIDKTSFKHLLIIDGSIKLDKKRYVKGDSLFLDSGNFSLVLDGNAKILIAGL